MRHIDSKIIEERKRRVLQAVIHEHIKTAKPVSSGVLTDDYDFDLSPATIRALMAELENEGFLTHPHTSAGRIPTDKGYRLYVDSLIELQRLAVDEESRIRREYEGRIREMEELLSQTSRVLSGLSHYSGFVIPPRAGLDHLQNIELIALAGGRVLAVIVTQSGMVRHRMVDTDVAPERLGALNRFLNMHLRGQAMGDVRGKLTEAIDDFHREERELAMLAQSLGRDIFDFEDAVYLDGTSNVLTLPEFQDYEPVRCLLRLNEDRGILKTVMGEAMSSDGVRVVIGSETDCHELKNMSVVSSIYKDGDNSVGVLGIIGPKRMEYPKMMALVGAVSRMVNRMLSREGGGDD